MKRLYVPLPTEAWEALIRASSRDLRHPSRQAAYILRETLLGGSRVAHSPEEPEASSCGTQSRRGAL